MATHGRGPLRFIKGKMNAAINGLSTFIFPRFPTTPRAASDVHQAPQGMPVEAPLVFRPGVHYMKNPSNTNRPESQCIYVQLAPSAPTHSAVYSGYTTMATAPETQCVQDFEEAVPQKRAPRWCDAETRHLLNIWTEEYPNIGRVRNAKEWERISKKLNKKLSDNGMVTFRTAFQCKVRMKYLIDEYNRVRRQNVSSETDEVTCDYYNEIDIVLGDSPVLPPAIPETSSETKQSNKAASSTCVEPSNDALATNDDESTGKPTPIMDTVPASSTIPEDFIALDRFGYYTEHESKDDSLLHTGGACTPGTSEKNTLPCSSQQERGEKRERPVRRETARKKAKKPTDAEEKESKTLSFLKEYLLESEKKDREFIMQLTQMDREREERGHEEMMNMMKEIAKIFKGDN